MAAFSLLDLVFAMGLAATLGSMAIPQTLSSLDEVRAVAAARHVANQLQRARTEAIARGAATALRVTRLPSGYGFQLHVDGNRNGVLSADILAGVDQPIDAFEQLHDRFAGVEFGALLALPSVDPAGTPPGTDPIRVGASDIATFTPLGTSTSGSLYILGRNGTQLVVRIYGQTGRTRVLRFQPGSAQWMPL